MLTQQSIKIIHGMQLIIIRWKTYIYTKADNSFLLQKEYH